MKLTILIIVCVVFSKSINARSQFERIIAGTETEIEKFRYLVSLQTNGITNGIVGYVHICGGAILSSNWILTAAHCLDIDDTYRVRVGSTKHNNDLANDYIITEIYVHPKFISGGENFDYDIALLKVHTPIIFSNKVQAIELDKTKIIDGTLGIIAGWGGGDPSAINANVVLNQVQLKIVGEYKCQSMHSLPITKNMMCVAPKGNLPSGMCQGDSGGPFVVNNKIVGISSWGIGCGLVESPGVLTRISSFISWINKIMNNNRSLY